MSIIPKVEAKSYWGVTMKKALRKLFSTTLQKRIENPLNKRNKLTPSLAGFRKNRKTADCIFTLFLFIEKSLSKGRSYQRGVSC